MSQPITPPAQNTDAQTVFNQIKNKLIEAEKSTNYFLNDVNNNNLLFPVKTRDSFDKTKNHLEDFVRRSINANINMNEGVQADVTCLLQKIYDLTAKVDNHDRAVM